MSKELVNEIRSGFGRLFDQQDYTYMVREMLQILARNLDDTVLDYGLELYGLHNSPLLSEQGSGSIAAQRKSSAAQTSASEFGSAGATC